MNSSTISRFAIVGVLAWFGQIAATADAALLAFNSFEGAPGELGYTTSVEDDNEGEIVVQSNPPVQDGSNSLMFNKIGDQPQLDFFVDFDPVNLDNVVDAELSFYWHANISNNNYEPEDSLTFTVAHDGTGGPIVTVFDNNDLNAARNGTSTDEWQLFQVSVPDDATTLSFSVFADFNANVEDMFFDNLQITGNQIPEPGTLSLCAAAGLGLLLRRRRRA